jgi:hypothetical protein
VTLFYSYAHEDEDLRKQLEDHLSLLHRQGLLSSWHDRAILAGGNWAGEIDDHLNSADLILLLVSVAFLASDYLYDIEMQRALERHQRGEARVIPIILRHCDWSNAPFATLQVLPTDAQPVTQWHDRDEAWTDVTRGIRKALEELLNGKGKKETSLSEEQQLQPRSTSSLGKRLGQRAVILLGIALLIVLLLSAILWRYVPFIGDTSHRLATATRQATATMRAAMPSGSIYTVKNTSEDLTLPDGVYFRHSLQTDPSHPTPTPMFGFGVFKAGSPLTMSMTA